MNDSNQSPYERLITSLEVHGSRVKKLRAKEVMAQCPSHEDHNPSLHVTDGGDKVLLRCMAGCPTRSVLDALGLEDEDLFAEKGKTREIVDTYDYSDENGKLLFQAIRFYPKGFAQRKPLPGDQWAWNLTGVRRVLYHLPELVAAPEGSIVYLVEGEKDADRLMAAGVLATTAPMGAGKWKDEYCDFLRDKKVIVVADADASGREHAATIAASLTAFDILHRVVEPKEGKDVSDHLDRGHPLEDLVRQERQERRLPGRNEGEAEFRIGNLHVVASKPQRRGTSLFTTIYPRWLDMGRFYKASWGTTVNLHSGSARRDLITDLRRYPFIDGGEAAEAVEELWYELGEWANEPVPVLDLNLVPKREDPPFMIQPWWVGSGATALVAAPGARKSYLALQLALSVASGEAKLQTHRTGWAYVPAALPVMFLDWEDGEFTAADRKRALGDYSTRLLYRRMVGPLAVQASDLAETLQREGVAAVVIDSLSAAISGSMVDDDSINAFWDAVALLGVPALVVAHKSAENIRRREARFFGSIMNEARVRLAWNLEANDQGFVVAECFKDNNYGLRGVKTAWETVFESEEPFTPATRVQFIPVDPTIVVFDTDDEPHVRRERPLNTKDRILAFLRDMRPTTYTIHELVTQPRHPITPTDKTVANKVNELVAEGLVQKLGEGALAAYWVDE